MQRWLPEFDQPLGEPLGPAVFQRDTDTQRDSDRDRGRARDRGRGREDGGGRWTRQFKSGTVVEFVVEPYCRGTIRWADGSVSIGNGGCDETPTAPPGATGHRQRDRRRGAERGRGSWNGP